MTIDQYLSQLLEHCGFAADQVQVEVQEEENQISVQINLDENESGAVIGYHGEGLESIQRMARVVFSSQYPDKKIVINVNDYRQKRNEKLEELTAKAAEKVLRTGQPFTFRSYLPAYERFVVHTTLSENSDFKGLESISAGEGKSRRLTIQKASKAE